MRRVSECNISVLETGKQAWQCGLLANHHGPCVPAKRYLTETSYPGAHPYATTEQNNQPDPELNADMRVVYLWLMIVTVVVALFGVVTLYSSVAIYQFTHP